MSNATDLCPTTYPGILDNTPTKQLALATTIFYPFLVVIFVAVFWYYKNSTVFLRKRSLKWVIAVASGTFVTWSVTVLYDYIGSEYFPCWLFMLLSYLSGPVMFTPGLIIVLEYVTTVLSIRLAHKLNRKRQAESADGDAAKSSEVNLEPELSFSTFRKHVRVTYCSSRKEEDLIGNLKFYKTRFGLTFYFLISMALYPIAFIIRFITNPQWAYCVGCELYTIDAALLIAFAVFTQLVAWTSNTTKVKQLDALRLIREWMYAWTACSQVAILAYILYLTDPGNLYTQGIFNWRSLVSVGVLLALYTNTIHQVWISRKLKQKLLLLPTLNRADRFDDVMRDKAMYTQLRNFLDAELSSEILLFLRAVENFKANYNKEGTQRRAREMLDTFIIMHAPLEINIPSDLKHILFGQLSKGNVNINVFDSAYDLIKESLLYDGFARFLHKMEREERSKQATIGAVAPESIIVASDQKQTGG